MTNDSTENMNPPSIPEIPNSDGSDIAYGIGQVILSLLPGPVNSIAAMLIRSPMDRRNDNWRIQLTKVIAYLFERMDENTFEALKHNEEFATTILHATRAAMFTHRKEKHEMLRNAVLNSALPNAPEDDERTVFLNLIEEFSVTHIFILLSLEQFRAPRGLSLSLSNPQWRNESQLKELYELLSKHLQEPRPQYQFFVSILSDVYNKGLIDNYHSDESHPSSPSKRSLSPELTDFGRRFLKFIESPLDD